MLSAVFHFFFFLIFQLEIYLFSLKQESLWSFLGQFENLLISAVIFILFTQTTRFIRALRPILMGSLYIFLSFDQLYYFAFQQHYLISKIEFSTKDIPFLILSLPHYAWFCLALNLVIFAVAFTFTKKIHLKFPNWIQSKVFLFSLPFILFVLQYLVLPKTSLNQHPVLLQFELLNQPLSTITEQDVLSVAPLTVFSSPRYQPTDLSSVVDLKNKNIVLIVLESVGSSNIIKDGLVMTDVYPYLSSQASQQIIFPNVYGVFPGTTRFHLALHTGGEVPTTSSYLDVSHKKYTEATLVSELKQKGYSTFLVSVQGLSFESLNDFYSQMNFDFFYDPDKNQKKYELTQRKNTWGVDEFDTLPKIEQALEQRKSGHPFYLQINTTSTHYPYAFNKSIQTDNTFTNYKNASSYVDRFIYEVVEKLKNKKIYDDTVIFITGDHGEAFADLHKDNWGHRNYLYEENIKSFLIIMSSQIKKNYVSNVIAGVKDIKPTILSVDKSLLSKDFKSQVQFFYKNTSPEQVGLFDGRYKVIKSIYETKPFEVYDLWTDPTEQHRMNLPDAQYRLYISNLKKWLKEKDESFRSKMK